MSDFKNLLIVDSENLNWLKGTKSFDSNGLKFENFCYWMMKI